MNPSSDLFGSTLFSSSSLSAISNSTGAPRVLILGSTADCVHPHDSNALPVYGLLPSGSPMCRALALFLGARSCGFQVRRDQTSQALTCEQREDFCSARLPPSVSSSGSAAASQRWDVTEQQRSLVEISTKFLRMSAFPMSDLRSQLAYQHLLNQVLKPMTVSRSAQSDTLADNQIQLAQSCFVANSQYQL